MARTARIQSVSFAGISAVERRPNTFRNIALMGVSALVFLVPLAGIGLSHLVDRTKNRMNADDELKARTNFYREQVARQLGIEPGSVNLNDFLLAAQTNPQLRAAVEDVRRKQASENRGSIMAVGGAAAVGGIITPVGMGAKLAVDVAGMTAGGMLSSLFDKKTVNAQEVTEAMAAARQQGQPISPQHVFMLRVAQDEGFAGNLKKTFGKDFHKMTPDEQTVVMQSYPALANASTTEAYAVNQGMIPVQELMARAPNLNGVANQYAVGRRNASFTDQVNQRRALAAQQVNAPAV